MKLIRLLFFIGLAWIVVIVALGGGARLFGQATLPATVSAVEAAAMWSQGYANGVQSQTPLLKELKDQLAAKDMEIAKLTAEIKSLKETQ